MQASAGKSGTVPIDQHTRSQPLPSTAGPLRQGMQCFNEIRAVARDKRDKAIKKAKEEYAATLARVAAVEQDITGRDPSDHRSISSCIESVIPSDRPFSTVDIMAGLEALDPARVWRRRSIDNHVSRLRKRGLVRRLQRSKGAGEPAIYIRADVEYDNGEFDDTPLKEAVQAVREQNGMALTATDIVVLLAEKGYQTQMSKANLRVAVTRVLRAM